ncbi:MAG: hypothetical protein HYS15_02505, partial [Candidatus Spechtbacteria bacterium]|nr:hypothetical protein [Candidatus Spechtbacteria bacterium]
MSNTFLKKTIALTASIATTISVSGIAMVAPIFVATAATIVDGDTIKTADSFDVFIVKHVGAKKFKRLILNPAVFNSYGHLSWAKIKTVTSAEMAVYTDSQLVRAVNDPKVYKLSSAPDSDTGVRAWVNMTAAEFVANGYDWDAIYEINAVDRDNYTMGADVTPAGATPAPTPVPATSGVTVSLASDNPAAGSVALSSSNAVFAKFSFMGGSANSTITSVVITRNGLAADADITDVKLWDGATQLGSTQALNTTTHKATFTGLSWVVPAGTAKVLSVTASIAASGTATVGNLPSFGIGAMGDVVGPTTVAGSFPIYGNKMTIAGVSVGRLDVVVRTVPANNSPVSGSTDQEVASWTFSAVNEGMSVKSVKLTQVGSAANADISNIKLKISGVQIGSTVAALASTGSAMFDLASAPISIDSGASKIVYAYTDISSGINTSRTVNFEITNAADVTAVGANSVGSVTITGSAGATFSAQTGTAQTISQGTVITVTSNGATNPSAQTFVRGQTQQLISAFRFSAGGGEDQRVARIRLSLGGTGADATDISNVTLYKYNETTGVETQVGTPTSFVGTLATYGANGPGLDDGVFDVVKNGNVVIHVRADISSAASWTAIGIFVNEVRVDGITSKADIGAATITAIDALAEVTSHNAQANVGTITMGVSPSNPAAQNVVPGTTGFVMGKFDFTATNEDITLSSVIVDLCDAAACTNEAGNTTSPAEASDFSNVKLWNGATQIGNTVASPSTQATFSINVAVQKNKTVTLSVTADVPTNAATAWASAVGAVGIDRDITATGVASQATVTDPTADALGNAMTATAETLTVAFQGLPATTVVLNAANVVLAKTVLTSGTAGDVRVTSIKFSLDDVTAINSTSAANTSLSSLALYDGVTMIGGPLSITDATPDTVTFSGLNLLVPKGTQKLLDLKASALVAGTFFTGFADLTVAGGTDVVSTGSSSNTTIYGTGTDAANSGSLVIAAAGTLTVAVDAATPLAQYVAVGTTAGKTGVEFAKWKFTSANEPIDIESLAVTMQASNNTPTTINDVPDFVSIQLYNGATAVSSVGFPTGTNITDAATTTFTFTPQLRIPKDSNVVLTLKASMTGTSNGATSSSTPRFFIFDVTGSTDGSATGITGRGVDSGARVTSAAGTPNPQ